MAHIRTRTVGDNWTWFEEYVFLWSKWTVQCEEGRTCQVGMGVSIGGEPRGEKIRFTRRREFTTVGAGSIHVRVVDGQGPCTVRLDQGSVGLIPIVRSGPAVVAANASADMPSTGNADDSASPSVLSDEAVAAIEQFNRAAEALRQHLPQAFPTDGEDSNPVA